MNRTAKISVVDEMTKTAKAVVNGAMELCRNTLVLDAANFVCGPTRQYVERV